MFPFLDFVLKDIWKDPDNLKNFMVKNLSIPEDLAESFLNSTVNGSEVQYHLRELKC